MEQAALVEAAEALAAAQESRSPIDPLSATHPELTPDEAYAISVLSLRRREAAGDRLVGYKVGLTSQAMQRQLGVSQPDYGHLLKDMVHTEREPIDAERFIAPRIEPELAFVLGDGLPGPATPVDAARAVAAVVPALEIIDSRIRDWRITLVDTIADNASSGAVVLGAHPAALADVDLRLGGCNMYRNGELVATGATGAVLGSPLAALAWLAGVDGVRLARGHVVLSGSVTSAVPVAAGDVVTATFAGLAPVTARFASPSGDPR